MAIAQFPFVFIDSLWSPIKTVAVTVNNIIAALNQLSPVVKGTVTQATSITTGVTVNADAGVITTVSSTLASGSSTTFTVTDNVVTAASVILLTVDDTAAGVVKASVTSIGAGSFQVKLLNQGSGALAGIVKVYFKVF